MTGPQYVNPYTGAPSWLSDQDREGIRRQVKAQRAAQGLPEFITDQRLLGRLADRCADARRDAEQAGAA